MNWVKLTFAVVIPLILKQRHQHDPDTDNRLNPTGHRSMKQSRIFIARGWLLGSTLAFAKIQKIAEMVAPKLRGAGRRAHACADIQDCGRVPGELRLHLLDPNQRRRQPGLLLLPHCPHRPGPHQPQPRLHPRLPLRQRP